ncbi:MAG: hypothetical protein EPN47_09465 [Acidobacteria bacterium]|nr:MAG: hypothetical protein EPN47_09465 [Acidobacteriota bacterium]
MKRLPGLSGLICTTMLALGALALIAATATPARAVVSCGVTVTMSKSCQPTTLVGEKDDCTITLTNSDTCTNTYQINSGSDVIHASGGDVTDLNLPISAVSGTTTCTVAGALPCNLSTGASVTFHDNSYTVVSGDFALSGHNLPDTGTVNMTDLCNNNATGCSSSPVGEQATAATTVQSCSVTIDKQISCDGGTTWTNATTASTGVVTGTCTGFNGDPIQVRYVYQNTGSAQLTSCNIHDVTGQTAVTSGGTAFTQDTSVGTINSGGSAITSSVITTSDGTTPLTCNAAGPNFDSANIDCICGTSTIHADANDTANFSCESCSVQIDKQVSCAGAGFVDVFGTDDTVGTGADTTVDSCTGFDAFTGHTADNIAVQYVIKNTGTDNVASCTYGETNIAITGQVTIPGAPATINSGASQTVGPFNNLCSPTLVQNEVGGQDTATIGCTCAALTNNATVKTVGFHDTAGFACLAPGLNVSKTCDPQSGSVNNFTVNVTNSGSVNLTNCNVTDAYQANDSCTNIALVSPVDATSSLSPAGNGNYTINSGDPAKQFTGSISGLTANACNQASVTCTIAGSSQTITATSQDTCAVSLGCETRTPGFWKTHPNISFDVMTAAGGFIQSCGLDLNNVSAGVDCSAVEDMCSLGQDAAKLGIDPTQANLIFQCAAAELNLAVTQQDGGNCGNTIPNSILTFDQCCGLAGACATGDPNLISGCQQAVSAFNAQFDTTTLNSGSVLNTPGADSSNCRVANGNGFVNDQSAIGASSPVADCNATGRKYLVKTTGSNTSSTNNGKNH